MQHMIAPSKSPLKRGTLTLVPPLLRGASAVLGVSPMSDWRGLGGIEDLSQTLMKLVLGTQFSDRTLALSCPMSRKMP